MMHSLVAIEGATQRRSVMEQTHSKKLQLGRLVADALGEIQRLGYSRGSRDRYLTTWKQLIEFSQHAWDSAKRSQCRTADSPCSQGCNDSVGMGSGTDRPASRCSRSQFCERETRLRHPPTGMPVGTAHWRYSHAETGQPALGGVDHRNHASEDGHAVDSAFAQRGRRGLD